MKHNEYEGVQPIMNIVTILSTFETLDIILQQLSELLTDWSNLRLVGIMLAVITEVVYKPQLKSP